MKNIYVLIFILGVLLTSCQNEEDVLNGGDSVSLVSNIPIDHQLIIRQLGLDITTFVPS